MDDDHLEETYSVLTADEESLFANDLSDRESTDGSLVAVSLVEDSDDYEHSTDEEADEHFEPMMVSSVNDTPRDGAAAFRFGGHTTLDAVELLPGGASWMTEGSDNLADATIAGSRIELVFPDPTSSCSSSSSTITDPSFSLLGLPAPPTDGSNAATEMEYAEHYSRLLRALRKADALEEWLRKYQDSSASGPSGELGSRRLMTTRERADALETWLLEKRPAAPELAHRRADSGSGSSQRPALRRSRSSVSAAKLEPDEQADTVPQGIRGAIHSVAELVYIFARLVDLAVGRMFRGWLPLVLLLTIASDVWYQYSTLAGPKDGAGLSTTGQATANISPIAFAQSAISAISRVRDFAPSDIIPFSNRKRSDPPAKKKPFVMPSGRDRLRRHLARIKQHGKAAGQDMRALLKNGVRKITLHEVKEHLKATPKTARRVTAKICDSTAKAALRARNRADEAIYKKSAELRMALQLLRTKAKPATKRQLHRMRNKMRRIVRRYMQDEKKMPEKSGIKHKAGKLQPKAIARRPSIRDVYVRLRRLANRQVLLLRR